MANTELESQDIDPSGDPLWERIEAYDFDALDPGCPFAATLARENRWTVDYAERVIEEYRRFCYLAVRVDNRVVPSDQVDQVWRLHIGFSREYWQDFCAKVLRAELHHEPMRTGAGEADQCRTEYEATLAAYERVSGDAPPADIWPPPAVRFRRDGAVRRVDTKEYLFIRRPPKALLWVIQLGLILMALFFLWEGEFTTAIVIGAATGALAIYRDWTDNPWKRRPWHDHEVDHFTRGRRRDL